MRKTTFLFLLLSFFASANIYSSHIQGVDFEYSHLFGRTFEIQIRLYHDCSATGGGLFRCESVSGCTTGFNIYPAIDTIYELPWCDTLASLCASPATAGYGGKVMVLKDTIAFPTGCNDWRIFWQSCCQQPGLANVALSSSTDHYYEMEFDPSFGSDSPVWDYDFPPISIVGTQDTILYTATDPDGDLIVYSMVDILQDANTPSAYNPGYSTTTQFSSAPGTFSFNPANGVMAFTGNQIQRAMVKVRAEEWRAGVRIGYVTREVLLRFVSGAGFSNGCPPGGYTNLLCGNVYVDLNGNCMKDAGEPPFYSPSTLSPNGNWTIGAITQSNAAGNYLFWRGAGTDSIELRNPDLYPQDPTAIWEATCFPPAVTFPGTHDTLCGVDFGIQARDTCPQMRVNITYNRFRFCNKDSIFIQYRNTGSQTATGAYLEVRVPDSLTVDSASVAWSSYNGNLITFPLGNVAPFASGTIILYNDSICNPDLMFRTFPWYAHVYPDTSCQPISPNWDESHIEVINEYCQNDSFACFTIKNTGTGNMADSSVYFIYINGSVAVVDSFMLNAGDSLNICYTAHGNTISLRAMNNEYHPWYGIPFNFLEMCDTLPAGMPFSPFASSPYYYNADPFHDYLFPQLGAPYDPNDKTVDPIGIDPNFHWISDDQDLTYKIRFQNLGNDTALQVLILDTLPQELDITTFRPIFASHPYQVTLLPNRVVQIFFLNANLPPASVNDAASQGFIEFEIEQMSGNPIGTRIENRAAIYFDFNPPIFTDYAFNTVGDLGELTSATNSGPRPEEPKAVAFPNPFSESVTIRLEKGRGLAAMYDLYGRKIAEKPLDAAGEAQFDLNGYADGMYLYTISRDGRRLAAGKVLKR